MKDEILKAYQAERAANPGGTGKAPELVPNDHVVALLAASHSENDLRQAATMRAAFNRKILRDNKALQDQPAPAAASK
jgi:hypothetical protein